MCEDLKRRLASLELEASGLLAELENKNADARRLAEEKKALVGKIRALRAKALEYKSMRDSLNEEVKNFKAILAELKREYGEKLESLKGLKLSIKDYLRFRPAKSEEILAREIADLDWKIQTTPMPIAEEQKIIEKIRALERQMEFYRKIKSMKEEVRGLENRLGEIKNEIALYRRKIAESAAESQSFHDMMVKTLNEVNELKSKLNDVNSRYMENRGEAAKLHLKRKELLSQIHTIRSLIREEEERRKRESITAIKEKVKREALEKIKRGEKVSFEEFKILVEEEEP
ncbi:MAG: hypothetical protein N3E47_06250 [Candidatus Bathyarchaeota archaeon]|nr:hypothetical protein [Candidatus Bathyarchaeota archaeon]